MPRWIRRRGRLPASPTGCCACRWGWRRRPICWPTCRGPWRPWAAEPVGSRLLDHLEAGLVLDHAEPGEPQRLGALGRLVAALVDVDGPVDDLQVRRAPVGEQFRPGPGAVLAPDPVERQGVVDLGAAQQPL